MAEEKYPDSPRNIDLSSICLDARFGDLKFSNALPQLQKMQETMVELEDLDYKEHLTKSEINNIESLKSNLNSYINQIKNFNLTQGNPQQTRNNIETQVNSYYENNFPQTRNSLTYLYQHSKLDQKTEKELKKTVANAKKLEKQLQDKLDALSKDEEAIENKEGIVSSKFLSQEFEEQFSTHSAEAEDKWFSWIQNFYIALAVSIVVAFIGYIVIRNVWSEDPVLAIEWGVFTLLAISFLFFGLKFAVRNFNIHKNLASVNRHRRNVAQTFVNFLNSEKSSEEVKSVLLKDASSALFEHHSTGYLEQDNLKISTPVQEMVTKVVTDKV